jgi:WhiB family redox-sensing transcriptional regulator
LVKRLDAPCRGLTELFFSDDEVDVEQAKAVCATCPHQEPCAVIAVAHQVTEGVWGGMTAAELQAEVDEARRRSAD